MGKVLIRQSFDTFIRIWGNVGYIVNKANYNDRVTNRSGSVFLKYLSRSPRELDEICRDILGCFNDVDFKTIKSDAICFYEQLERDGFILIGKSLEELNRKEKRFSYGQIKPRFFSGSHIFPSDGIAIESSQSALEKMFQKNPQLVSFQIELTSKCNERCIHCYIPHENKTTDIQDDLFYSVMEQCKHLNVLSVTFSGGEPMMHPHFLKYLQKAKDYDFAVNVLSNLTLLNDEIIDGLRRERLASLQVSLYSMTPEVHDSITGLKGSFEKTTKAILKCIRNNIPLQISAPCMKDNKDTIMDVFDWGERLGVRVESDYNIMAKYNHDTSNLEHRLSVADSKDVIRGIIEHNSNYRNALLNANHIQSEYNDNEPMCGVGQSFCCMVANGDVYPCAGWQSYVCGNLYNETLENIWNNSERIEFIRSIRRKDFPRCKNCEDRKFCHLCMSRLSNENSDGSPFHIIPHFCQSAHMNRIVAEEWIKEQRI